MKRKGGTLTKSFEKIVKNLAVREKKHYNRENDRLAKDTPDILGGTYEE